MWTSAPARAVAGNHHPHTQGHVIGHAHAQTAGPLGDGDLSALEWSVAFDAQRFIDIPSIANATSAAAADATNRDCFCVYTAGPTAVTTAAAVATAASSAAPSSPRSSPPPFVALLLHGGGQSSLAWACVAAQLKRAGGASGGVHVLAIDLRGHGHTRTSDEGDLSMQRMVDDVIAVMRAMYAQRMPPLLLVGHSLGGALAVHLAASKQLPVCGLVMVDLVEGSAVDSLTHMRAVVESRPTHFRSPEAAVAWALRAGALRNATSARFSMPDQLVQSTLQQHDSDADGTAAASTASVAASSTDAVAIPASSSAAPTTTCYRWRTDLVSSERYWSGWFAGLSALFLSCSMPKLLLLASAERMDPPMMVAHMQGKLAVDVVQQCGHSVQEDQPVETARKIAAFAARHKLATMAGVWATTAASASSGAAAIAAVAAAANAASSSAATVVAPPPGGSTAPSSIPHATAPSGTAPSAAAHAHAHGGGKHLPPVPLFHDK
jgi:protein phosphatase methylesterase 1